MMEKCIKMNMPKYRQGDTAYILLGKGDSGFLVTINDLYFIDNQWKYEIDCSMYSQGMILENVPEDYLCKSVNPKKNNKIFTLSYLKSLHNEYLMSLEE